METKKKANAPKWGTKEWLVAYPWSQMDRRRRARVRKAIGEESWKELTDGLRMYWVKAKLEVMMERYNVVFAKKDRQAFEKALCTVSKYEAAIYDEVIGRKLAAAWKLEI